MMRPVRHPRNTPGWVPALVLAATTLASSNAARAQQLRPDQIQVFISATDAGGNPVTDIKPEEITMTENGAPGKILSVERHTLPIKLTITVDNGREAINALAALRAGLTGLVEALPADVEVTLMTTAPQAAVFVRPTTAREEITRGIERFGVESRNDAVFSEAIIEYATRLDRDARDKKLTYAPMLVMVSMSAPENSDRELDKDRIEKAMKTLVTRGARLSLVMTTTRPTNAESVDNLKNGRQVLIAAPIIQASQGRFETLVAFSRLTTLLPEWGKEIASAHTRQTNQVRVVIERPGGSTGALNNPALRLTRQGLNGSVSMDGRFIQ